MAVNRKLGRPSDQRVPILRGLVTALLWNGKIVTTEARAKEVRRIAEKFITLAVREYANTVTVDKVTINEKNQKVTAPHKNDAPSRLHARRMMLAYFYNIPQPKKKDETKAEYRERTGDIKHALIEKMFNEIGPKYDKRRTEKGPGGYTRILKLGKRRGDAADMVVLELV